jgi:hypothetical protein
MARTVTFIDLKIVSLWMDMLNERVVVRYKLVDSAGKEYEEAEAVFWKTLPAAPNDDVTKAPVLQHPPNWYVLPAKHSTALLALVGDARTALMKLLQ